MDSNSKMENIRSGYQFSHKYIIGHVLFIILLIISSGAIFELIRDGGAIARYEGFSLSGFEGRDFLGNLEVYWSILAIFYIFHKIIYKQYSPKLSNSLTALLITAFTASLLAESPLNALKNLTIICIAYGFGVCYTNNTNLKEISTVATTFVKSILILSIFVALLLPSYGVGLESDGVARWQGVFNHKNSLAIFCVVGLTIFFSKISESLKIADLIWISLAYITLVFTGSTTSMFAGIALFPLFAIQYYFPSKQKIEIISTAAKITILLFGFALVYFSLNFDSIEILGKDSTFSSRNRIWSFVLDHDASIYLIGNGVNSFTSAASQDPVTILRNLGFMIYTTHNGFLDVYYSTGVIGLVILIFHLVVHPPRLELKDLSLISYYLIPAWLVINIFESKLLSLNIFIVFHAVTCAYSRSQFKTDDQR